MYTDSLIKHVKRHIGPITTIYEEIISDDLPIGVIHVGSSFFRRYEVIVTKGMSAKPMDMPDDCTEPKFAEILAVLPKGWPLKKVDFNDENNYWPIRLIKTMARYPAEAETWFGFGHTLANGDSETTTEPYAPNTKLCASILLPPMTLDEKAWNFRREDGQEIFFWAAVPLYMSELNFKRENGPDPLLDLFDKERVTDIIDPIRKPVV